MEGIEIIKMPKRVAIGQEFIIVLKIHKTLEAENVKFLYCHKNEWFQTKEIIFKKQNQEEKFQYFYGKVTFHEQYMHYCCFMLTIRGQEAVIKKDFYSENPIISYDGEGPHWEIYAYPRRGKKEKILKNLLEENQTIDLLEEVIKAKKQNKDLYVVFSFKIEEEELYCYWLDKKAKINKDNVISDILDIIGELMGKRVYHFYYSFDRNVGKKIRKKIESALKKEEMYFYVEGIVILRK